MSGIDSEPVKRKLVASIASVSQDLGIAVVAEGIETPGERNVVVDLGCDLMQGFLFRRPEELDPREMFPLAVGNWAPS